MVQFMRSLRKPDGGSLVLTRGEDGRAVSTPDRQRLPRGTAFRLMLLAAVLIWAGLIALLLHFVR